MGEGGGDGKGRIERERERERETLKIHIGFGFPFSERGLEKRHPFFVALIVFGYMHFFRALS